MKHTILTTSLICILSGLLAQASISLESVESLERAFDPTQIPEVKEQMKDLPVNVIYLCMEDNAGSNLANWKETVASKASNGDHIFLPRSFARKFMDHFEFSYYPSYIFIDREGKLDKKFIKRISDIDLEKLKKRL